MRAHKPSNFIGSLQITSLKYPSDNRLQKYDVF